MRTLLIIIYLSALAFLVQSSEKKGVVHWAPSYMCDDFKALCNMSWWYDFKMNLGYYHRNNICSSTIDYLKQRHVPMVWGYEESTKISIDDEAQYILGFNEPNHWGQSDMTPEEAASAWLDIEKSSKGRPLVSPSAAVCDDKCMSSEIEWFDEFFRLCEGCRVDYLATHTYWCKARKVMSYLKQLYDRYGRKIWLTEFACGETLNPTMQLDFMKEILPQLEAADYVFRYSWYSARITESGFVTTAASLLEPDRSALTPLGRYYNEFIPGNPTTPSDDEMTPSSKTINANKVGKEETLLILQAFKSNPTLWWDILRFMEKNAHKLPKQITDVYRSASKTVLKQRIKKKFKKELCSDVEQDSDIRDMVEAIWAMPRGSGSGGSGMLLVPYC